MNTDKGNNASVREVHNWIDGKLFKSTSERFGSVTDSATGEQCA